MAIFWALALTLQGAGPSVLDVLPDEWVCEEGRRLGPTWRHESWRRDGEGRLTGTIETRRTTAGPQVIRQEAQLTISGRGRRTRLTYRAEDGRTMHYRLARNERMEAVFESIGDGSPRVISYRYDDGFRELEVLHGLANGSSRRWVYRASSHMAPGTCDGRR